MLRKKYSKPLFKYVKLVPDEVIALGCWNCGATSGGFC